MAAHIDLGQFVYRIIQLGLALNLTEFQKCCKNFGYICFVVHTSITYSSLGCIVYWASKHVWTS